LNTQRWQNR